MKTTAMRLLAAAAIAALGGVGAAPVDAQQSMSPGTPVADLAVLSLSVPGEVRLDRARNKVEIPVKLVIQNSGNADAASFAVSMNVTQLYGNVLWWGAPALTGLVVEGKRNACTDAPLKAGETRTLTGTVVLAPTLERMTLPKLTLNLGVSINPAPPTANPPSCGRIAEASTDNNTARVRFRIPP
jgi:hypothetical protein